MNDKQEKNICLKNSLSCIVSPRDIWILKWMLYVFSIEKSSYNNVSHKYGIFFRNMTAVYLLAIHLEYATL